MTTMGMQSSAALATPVAQLVRPGLRWERDHRGLAGDAGIGVGGVAGNLLVADGDEVDRAFGQRSEHGDVGVAAKAEDMLDAAALEEIDQVLGDGLVARVPCHGHHATSRW